MKLPAPTKKILYLITQSSPWGGAQRYVYDMALSFHHKGWPVTVMVGGNEEGALGKKLTVVGIPVKNIPSLTRAVRPMKNIQAIFEIRALCKEFKPDIVHCNSSMAGVLGAVGARLAGVKKIIYTVHGLVLKEPLPGYLKYMYWCAEWIAGKLRDTTICVSEDDRRAATRAHIAKLHYTITIPIGIDTISFLARDSARISLLRINPSLDPASVWIGSIAGLYKTKGLDILLKAAHELINVRVNGRSPLQFLIIGEGPERKKLEQIIIRNQLQKNCRLLGHIPDAARYLKAFDCFVLPSLKEGLPYTILEALAAHIPVIATRVGGIPEVMREDAAHRIITPNEGEALANAITSLIASLPARSLLPQTTPSFHDMIEATEQVYLL
ncbi:MAG: glycosyltransferase [Patescibacteria group bacterium]